MADTIRIKRRAAGGAAGPPASLAAAELAYNEQDDKLYYGKGNSGGAATSIVAVGGPGALGGGGGVAVSDTPPASPTPGSLWWESDTGTLWVYYDDGNTTQWVSVSATPEAASRVLLATILPAGTTPIVIGSSILTASYDVYEVDFTLFNTGGNAQIFLRYSTDGGASYWVGASDYRYSYNYGASNASGSGGGTASSAILMGLNSTSGAVPASGTFKIFRPSVNGISKAVHYNVSNWDSNSFWYACYGAGALLASTLPVNALQLQFGNSLNFGTSSLVKVYGLK